MNSIVFLVFAAVAWLIAVPWLIALWFSPQALLWLKRRLVARADALTASRAAYKVAHESALYESPVLRVFTEAQLEGDRQQ